MDDMEKKANEIRLLLYKTIAGAGGGHFGGNLSLVEIMTVLYYKMMNVDNKKPRMKKRDKLVMSKGHAGPVLYTVLASKGFFGIDKLAELDQPGGMLQKHADAKKVPGVDVSTGALGQGLSVGAGIAAVHKSKGDKNRIYVILGDGECNEGQVWEAAQTASKYHLDNLCVLVDCNSLQIDGAVDQVMPLENFQNKWESFGFFVQQIDGHCIKQITYAFEMSKKSVGSPSVILAKTIKGKGVSFMENQAGWHSGNVSQEQYIKGLKELEKVNEQC